MTAAKHMQAYEHLYTLSQDIARYDGMTCSLRDNVLTVTEIGTGREEQFTCDPRPDDSGALWLYDSRRQAVAQAGEPDAALRVTRLVREGS